VLCIQAKLQERRPAGFRRKRRLHWLVPPRPERAFAGYPKQYVRPTSPCIVLKPRLNDDVSALLHRGEGRLECVAIRAIDFGNGLARAHKPMHIRPFMLEASLPQDLVRVAQGL
jgi:hypothetical protein